MPTIYKRRNVFNDRKRASIKRTIMLYVRFTNSSEYAPETECENRQYDVEYAKEYRHCHQKKLISRLKTYCVLFHDKNYSQIPPIEPKARAVYLSHQGESSLDARSSFGRCIKDPNFSAND